MYILQVNQIWKIGLKAVGNTTRSKHECSIFIFYW